MSSGMSANVLCKLLNCKKMRQAGDLKSMSSKTILLGLSIFQCGSERSMHGRPSWELAPYDCESERTKDFTAWCRDASTECCFNERAGECGVVRFTFYSEEEGDLTGLTTIWSRRRPVRPPRHMGDFF